MEVTVCFQIYEESGFFDNTLESSSRYIPRDDVVNVVTYNANSSFSLVRWHALEQLTTSGQKLAASSQMNEATKPSS